MCTASGSDDGAAARRQVDKRQCASYSPQTGSDPGNVDDTHINDGLGDAASATRKRHRCDSDGETPRCWTDTIVPNRYPSLEGHFVLEEFISEAEEAALLEVRIKSPPTEPWGSCFFPGEEPPAAARLHLPT
jgi:hypothetical protein